MLNNAPLTSECREDVREQRKLEDGVSCQAGSYRNHATRAALSVGTLVSTCRSRLCRPLSTLSKYRGRQTSSCKITLPQAHKITDKHIRPCQGLIIYIFSTYPAPVTSTSFPVSLSGTYS